MDKHIAIFNWSLRQSDPEVVRVGLLDAFPSRDELQSFIKDLHLRVKPNRKLSLHHRTAIMLVKRGELVRAIF